MKKKTTNLGDAAMIKLNLIPTWVYVALALGAAGTAGWKVRDYDYQKHLKADAEAAQRASDQAREVEATNDQTSQDIGVKVEEAQTEIRYVTRTLIKEVPTYVTLEADTRCPVPLGAVRMLDAAARGDSEVALAPTESPDQASGIGLSGVVSSVVNNYGYTHELEAQVIGWQDWYEQVKKDWPTK